MQKTLVLLKPDCVRRKLAWKIISRFEEKWFDILGLKIFNMSDELVTEHYSHLADKPFFPAIKAYMTSAPVVAMAVSGTNVIKTVRILTGATNPAEAMPGSIRWDFALTIDGNVIHASDSEETAAVELKRFFKEGEITSFEKISDKIVG